MGPGAGCSLIGTRAEVRLLGVLYAISVFLTLTVSQVGLLVSGFNGPGLATMLMVRQLFPNEFRNIVFIGVAEVDSSLLKSHEEIEQLEKQVSDDLLSYCEFASQIGFHPELRTSVGPD